MTISWKTYAPVIVWLVLYLIPVPAGLNANQWHYFAIFAAVITGLILESMAVGANFWKFGLIFGVIYFAGLLVIVLLWLEMIGNKL